MSCGDGEPSDAEDTMKSPKNVEVVIDPEDIGDLDDIVDHCSQGKKEKSYSYFNKGMFQNILRPVIQVNFNVIEGRVFSNLSCNFVKMSF